MACKPEVLKNVPLFALLDDDELAVLAGQVDLYTANISSLQGVIEGGHLHLRNLHRSVRFDAVGGALARAGAEAAIGHRCQDHPKNPTMTIHG